MKYFVWDQLKNARAITTTRDIGNMAYQVEKEDPQLVRLRRGKVSSYLGIDNTHLIFTHQTHSDVIKEVTLSDIGRGCLDFESGIEADALYTREKGIAIGIFHADCTPLFISCPKIDLVGIIHAGYKGTLKHISYKAINHIKEKYDLNGEDIYIHIGPARQFFTFHVSSEEQENIIKNKCEKALRMNGENDALFDMPFSNIIDLIDAGIPLTNITSSMIDTTDDDNCYSAFIKEKDDGRMASIIMIEN